MSESVSSLAVTFVKIPPPEIEFDLDGCLKRIPKIQFIKNQRFKRREDQLRHISGLMLLEKTWKMVCETDLDLALLALSDFQRPYLPGSNIDFNLSHAGTMVTCVVAQNNRVGIDIEYKRAVDFNDFRRTMNPDQWKEILNYPDRFEKFFQFWSLKESVIKADGRGLSIPLGEIVLDDHTVSYQGKTWQVQPFALQSDYYGCVAGETLPDELMIKEVDHRSFLIQ